MANCYLQKKSNEWVNFLRCALRALHICSLPLFQSTDPELILVVNQAALLNS